MSEKEVHQLMAAASSVKCEVQQNVEEQLRTTTEQEDTQQKTTIAAASNIPQNEPSPSLHPVGVEEKSQHLLL